MPGFARDDFRTAVVRRRPQRRDTHAVSAMATRARMGAPVAPTHATCMQLKNIPKEFDSELSSFAHEHSSSMPEFGDSETAW